MSYQPDQPNVPSTGQQPSYGQSQYPPSPGGQQPPQYAPPGYGQQPPQYAPPGYGQPPPNQYPPSVGQSSPPIPGYYGYQPMDYAPPSAPVVRRKNPIYAVSGIGGLLLIICAFLPWVTATYLGQEIQTMTGLGSLSGPFSAGSATSEVKDGIFALGLGILILLIAVVGFFSNNKAAAIVSLVFAVAAIGLMLFELSDISSSVKTTISSTGIAVVNVGSGLYIGLAGAVIALVGSILIVVARRS